MKSAGAPPRLALRWLERFSGWEDDYGAAGDFEEFYHAQAEAHGLRRARRDCWRQVLAAFPGYVKNVFVWSDAMLKSYMKIALRNIWKHKGYSSINIAGLAAGMACALFILLWVQNEMSFDRFHTDAGTLFRLEQTADKDLGGFRHSSMPYPLGPILKAEIPEVREAVRIAESGSFLVRSGEKAFFESHVAAVDPQFLRMFAFPLIKGDPDAALGRPGSVVMTEDLAQKYFGGADPLGRTVTFNDKHAFMVTGVLKNIPQNSSLTFDMLLPFDFTRTLGQYSDSLTSNNIETYVRLGAPSDGAAVGEKITRLVRDRVFTESRTDPKLSKMLTGSPEISRRFEAYQKSRVFLLMPLVDIHLHGGGMAIRGVYLYGALALFVLLIAGINFMNLATARSAGRAKEIGLRKVIGARRKSLIGQFYGESLLTAALAGVVALLLVVLLFPAFRALSGQAIAWSTLGDGKFLIGMLAVVLLTGIVAGSYPALFLSSFQPIKALQGRSVRGVGGALFRKTLVFLQFSLSILLLIGMGIVSRQVDFMRAKKLGYEKEQLIYLPMRDQAPASYAAFKEKLQQNPRLLGVTAARHPPTDIQANDTYADWDGKDPGLRFKISFASVDFDFPETMRIEMIAGRPFSRSVPSDARRAFLVNEGVPRLMGLNAAAAVGRRFVLRGYEGTIVGVMRDFHYQSVRNAIEPLAVVVDPNEFRYAVVRLTAGAIPASLADVRKTWRLVYPQYPFEARFFDEDFDRMYREDERMGTILKVFSGLAVLIACLGLFGLASYTAERRTKEIGIRKVVGASSRGIVLLLSKEFIKCVLAANLVAWPFAYALMKSWLRSYAYNPGIAWWLFVAAGAGALAIALLTVSFQANRASRTNPATALKCE